MRDIPDVLAGGVAAGVTAGVSHEVSFGDLVLLLVLHGVLYHRVLAAEKKNRTLDT